jgi:hypothetical protein
MSEEEKGAELMELINALIGRTAGAAKKDA